MDDFIRHRAGDHLLAIGSVLMVDLPGCSGCPAYLGNGLVGSSPNSMRIDPKLSPHQVCRKYHFALLESIDIVLVRPEVAPAHQFGARIAWDFGEWRFSLVPSWAMSASEFMWEIVAVIPFVFFLFVCSEVGGPAIGMEYMSETTRCE